MEPMNIKRRREDDDSEEETTIVKSLFLPQEIIREILVRLPAKSIGRFRCVSKLFSSQSSDQGFAKSHLELIIRKDAERWIHPNFIVFAQSLYKLDSDSSSDGCEGIRDAAAVELINSIILVKMALGIYQTGLRSSDHPTV